MNRKKKILITGASRGIGLATARRFAEAGMDLVLICHSNFELLKKQAEEYRKEYDIACSAYARNVAEPDFAARIFAEEKDIDIVVNNAGISYVGLITDMTDEQYRELMSVNLDGVFYFCREAARCMVKRHSGRIINITSVWGEAGASTEVAYSASKAGIIGLTKALAKELAPSDIQVNAISCGMIDTDMNSIFTEDEKAEIAAEIPSDRIGRPEEVAELVYQVSEMPAYVTGQVIRIDGGWI